MAVHGHRTATEWGQEPACCFDGWLPGEDGVERCDECRRFDDDDQAAEYVYELLSTLRRANSWTAPADWELHATRRLCDPPSYDAMTAVQRIERDLRTGMGTALHEIETLQTELRVAIGARDQARERTDQARQDVEDLAQKRHDLETAAVEMYDAAVDHGKKCKEWEFPDSWFSQSLRKLGIILKGVG
jgi:hypothetical protein